MNEYNEDNLTQNFRAVGEFWEVKQDAQNRYQEFTWYRACFATCEDPGLSSRHYMEYHTQYQEETLQTVEQCCHSSSVALTGELKKKNAENSGIIQAWAPGNKNKDGERMLSDEINQLQSPKGGGKEYEISAQ